MFTLCTIIFSIADYFWGVYCIMPSRSNVKKSPSKGKRKTNLLKLCTAMNKLAMDAVDKEVVKRFKTVIDSATEDITKSLADQVINNSDELQINIIPEMFHPYVKHFLFMKKRNSKIK